MIDEKRLIGQLASERTKAYIAYETERKYWDKGYKDGLEFALKRIQEQPKVEEQKIDEKELIKRLENRTDGYRDELAKAETKEHKNFLSTVIGTLIDVTNMVRYWPKGDDEK
jgi:hypothetical protein